jgi:hypothetical protein
MFARRGQLAMLWIALVAFAANGCSSTGGQLGTLQTQNRSLLEQNRAQLAEMENLKAHARRLEDKLIEAEQRLAERKSDNDRRRVAASTRDSASVFDRSVEKENDGEASAGVEVDRR